ncbi:MAG: cupredoxin domain-containing protein [Levilactobacillus sp.]|jgi:plastocyanin domain-containing protein|uniref:cupredoxin domain-containing protein n=1 Tax=Levilactobacillus sp. TaxID=2767919 RepID=UPI00258FC1E3|nr:cupredoxin domain-containing protein [Levilactobacillus sp.]MCI1553128.1 cupredoxin domain-containing protein [Levilactobacillus sp.]MCI1598783.1 cupredoxin domain-containing protein [Levilactobacillus sp.]MCI1605175.1 cupredoxin domain-containing protein [Levilactobacillus sp.]
MTIKQSANITVDGGYQPAEIVLKAGVPADLTFTRVSDAGCLDQVHSAALKFSRDLPLNQPQTVTVDTSTPGEFPFSCGMDMFFGKVVVQP